MSLPKAQLVDPQGNMNLPGMTATGIVTATSLSGIATGSATGLTGNPDLDVGIVTASSFVGQGDGHAANLTGTPQLNLGVTTSTGFIGDAVGKAAGLTGTPNLNVGLITATSFVGFVTGGVTGNITGDVTGNITGNISGNVEGNVTGNVSGLARGLGINGINVWTGAGTSNLGVGVCTAVELHGDGSTLTGAGSSAYIAQEVTASPNASSETIIDLSDGNLIYFDQTTASTTVGFASTSPAEQITFIRDTGPVTPTFTTGGVEFGGADDYLSIPTSTDFEFGTGDYTIECWFYRTAGGQGNIYEGRDGGNTNRILFYVNSAEKIAAYINGSGPNLGSVVTTGRWYHAALCRSSGTNRIFLDGVLQTSWSDTVDVDAPSSTLWIGLDDPGSNDFEGYISNLRVIKGTALYTADFDPPFYDLTNVTNTKLLCCQSDSSATAAAVIPSGSITATGTVTAASRTITSSSSVTPSITWPDRVKWNDGAAPTLISNDYSAAGQIFHLTTVDTGLIYRGWEEIIYNPQLFKLFAWGGNNSPGMLGQNNRTSYSSPVQIGSSDEWTSLGVSGGNVLGTKKDSSLWSWGYNNAGMLGLNNKVSHSSPVQIPGSWSKAFQGGEFNGALKTDGTLWLWGINERGQLGENLPTATYRSSPIQVGTGTDWATMMGGNKRVLASKTDGSLWSWGYNNDGKLGLNEKPATANSRSSPTQIPGTWGTTKGKFATANNASFGIKNDGTLWAWGSNNMGALGRNQSLPTQRSSPAQLPGTSWQNIASDTYSTTATKTDGTLWSWGYNPMGQLGQNSRTSRSSPVQIPGTTWNNVVAYYQGFRATRTDGTLWCWGSNTYGKLGLNEGGTPGTQYSSPTQIPGTNWSLAQITSRNNSRGFAFQ